MLSFGSVHPGLVLQLCSVTSICLELVIRVNKLLASKQLPSISIHSLGYELNIPCNGGNCLMTSLSAIPFCCRSGGKDLLPLRDLGLTEPSFVPAGISAAPSTLFSLPGSAIFLLSSTFSDALGDDEPKSYKTTPSGNHLLVRG